MKNLILILLVGCSFSVLAQETIEVNGTTIYTVMGGTDGLDADPGTKVYRYRQYQGGSPEYITNQIYRKNNYWYGSVTILGRADYSVSLYPSNATSVPCLIVSKELELGTGEEVPNQPLSVKRITDGYCEDEPLPMIDSHAETGPNYIVIPSGIPEQMPENPANGTMFLDLGSGIVKMYIFGQWVMIYP